MAFELEVEVEVRVTSYTPSHPGVWSGHPDNWAPPEAADVEFETFDPGTGRPILLPEAAQLALYEMVLDELENPEP